MPARHERAATHVSECDWTQAQSVESPTIACVVHAPNSEPFTPMSPSRRFAASDSEDTPGFSTVPSGEDTPRSPIRVRENSRSRTLTLPQSRDSEVSYVSSASAHTQRTSDGEGEVKRQKSTASWWTRATGAKATFPKISVNGLTAPRQRTSMQSKVNVEDIELEELGVEFSTRAKETTDAGGGFWWPCRKPAAGATSLSMMEEVTPSQEPLPDRLMKWSAAFSCTYVIGSLALESACIAEGAGHALERLSTASWRLEAVVAVTHAAMAVLYAAAALSSAFLARGRRGCRRTPPKPPPKKTETEYEREMREIAHMAAAREKGPASRLGLWLDTVTLGGLVAELVHLTEHGSSVPTAAQWLMLLQLGKGWRIRRSRAARTQRSSFLEGTLRLFLMMAFWAHVVGCLLLLLGTFERSWGSHSWTDEMRSRDETCTVMYVESMYFAVLSLASVGYGDSLATPGEYSLNSFILLVGQLYAAKICADLTWLTATYNFSEAQYQARRAQMWIALQKMQVPYQLAGRVLAYQSYVAASTREDLSQAAFVGLSGNLKEELRIVAYRLLVCQAPFLRMQSKEVLSLIVGQLMDKVYLPLDVIMRTGDVGRELFFMRRGKAGVFNRLEGLNSEETIDVAITTDQMGDAGFQISQRGTRDVANVDPDGPAYRAGMRQGHVITHVNGLEVAAENVQAALDSNTLGPDRTFTLRLYKGNPQLTVYSVGNYFGELGMLTGNPRSAWVVASTYCVCSVLPYDAVEILTQEVPGAFTVLVQSIVSRYNMKPSVTYSEVARRILAKFDVDDLEDAYEKFCRLEGAPEEELSARNFDEALRRLKITELDRKILWADMDEDNSGFVSQDEFTSKLTTESTRSDASPQESRMTSKATFDSAVWKQRSTQAQETRLQLQDAGGPAASSRRARMRKGTKDGQLRFQRTGSRTGTLDSSRSGRRHGTLASSRSGRNPRVGREAAGALDAAGVPEQASRFLMELVLEVRGELAERREQHRQLAVEVAKLRAPLGRQPTASGWLTDPAGPLDGTLG